MQCTPCRINDCVGLPETCASLPPGGYKKVWIANACDIDESLATFESVPGNDKFLQTKLREFEFLRQRGAQIDSAPVAPNAGQGFFEISVILPLPGFAAKSQDFAKRVMRGAELVLIALGQDDRYYIFGTQDNPLVFSADGSQGVRGRVPGDDAILEVGLTVSDVNGFFEFLVGPETDPLETRLQNTRAAIDALVKCECTVSILSATPAMATFNAGATENEQLVIEIDRNNTVGDVTISSAATTSLPSGITTDLPITIGGIDSQGTITISGDGSQVVSTGTLDIESSGLGCDSDSLSIPIEVV